MKSLRFILILALLVGITPAFSASDVIQSPGGTLTVELHTGSDGLGWTVSRGGSVLYTESAVSITIGGKQLGATAKAKSVRQRSASETIRPVVPLKFAEIESRYTEATADFGTYQLLLRVMDNAVAHRFVLMQKGEVEIAAEHFLIRPAEGKGQELTAGWTAHYQTAASFNTSYEEPYQHKSIADWQADSSMATVPALLSQHAESPASAKPALGGSADDTQLLIGEADVDDYPRMFLRAADGGITPTFPKAPLAWEPWGDRGERITQNASYIAKTSGRRALPWRFVVVSAGAAGQEKCSEGHWVDSARQVLVGVVERRHTIRHRCQLPFGLQL